MREKIIQALKNTENENLNKIKALSDEVSILDYSDFAVEKDGRTIWTAAFQKAINEHELLRIPSGTYYIDNTVIIPSNRRIAAEDGAVIKQSEDVKVIMFRNEHTVDGTHKRIDGPYADSNISIFGGRWEESRSARAGYGNSGMYDESRSFWGVSACMFFNNIDGLTIQNAVFAHTGGFAVQVGRIKNALFENIEFDSCYADGLHINGESENIIARNIKGEVGDDIVALNMYDWQDSSVNFGKLKNVLCENIELYPTSRYKAIRILPAIYYFDDGTSVDCSAENIIMKNVKGIETFKMYFQTPSYKVDSVPEKGDTGSGDNIYFEDIDIDLEKPIDLLPEYLNSDPVKGAIAGFEFGANVGNIHFKNISITLHRDKFPMSYLVAHGPKSVRRNDTEVFDPNISSTIDTMTFENIKVNGESVSDVTPYVRVIEFDGLYDDIPSGGKGKINRIINK